jgi:hypothetical protein
LNVTRIGPAYAPKPVGTTLEATSLGSVALDRLSVGKGAVQSVFDGAINVMFPGGLVCLVPESAGKGPLNVTLKLPDVTAGLQSLAAEVGGEVVVNGPILELCGDRQILLTHAEIYHPNHSFRLPLVERERVWANSEAMRMVAIESGKMAGLGGLLELLTPIPAGAVNGKLNIFASAALMRIASLEKALLKEDRGALASAVHDLVGLGPGLTPSSDDMLAGLVLLSGLYSANGGRTSHSIRLLSEVIGEEVCGRTTRLSEEFLLQACSGNGNEPVLGLCSALLTGRKRSVEEETIRVLQIGETSGTDMILGVVLGARFCSGLPSGLAGRGLR